MRILFMILGFVFLGLGSIGIVLPILPTTPFLMLSAFCFSKSSKKLHDWFLSTKLYKNYLDSFVNNRAMTVKIKASIITSATIMLGICFFIMKNVPVARMIIAFVWICHILYFVLRVNTIKSYDRY